MSETIDVEELIDLLREIAEVVDLSVKLINAGSAVASADILASLALQIQKTGFMMQHSGTT